MSKNFLKWVVYCGLFLIPFVPFLVSSGLFFPFITTKAFVFRIVLEVIFAAWLILILWDKEYRLKKSPILYALLAFTIIIGLADLLGANPGKSFWSNFERMEGFVTILHLNMLFLVISSVFKDREWKWWWNTSLIASALMVVYCFFQLVGVTDIHQGGVRVDGTLGNAAYLGVYMLFHIFIAFYYLLQEKNNKLLKYSYGALIILQLIILYHTATRGAILGTIGGLIIIALLNIHKGAEPKLRKWGIRGLITLVILAAGFLFLRSSSFVQNSPVLSRFSSISLSEIKTEGRSFIWPMAWQGIKEKPLLGWGQDNFNYVFNEHYDPKMYSLEPWFDRAHNIFLDWGIAGGFLGLLSYLLLYVALLYSVWKKDKNMSHADKSVLTGLLAAYFFHNLFVFDHLISYILFLSMLAFVHSRVSSNKSVEGRNIPEALKWIVTPAVIVGLCLVLYFVNIKPISANHNLILALSEAQVQSAKADSMQKFKDAYAGSRLGRPEVVEWIAGDASTVLSADVSTQVKNDFYTFAQQAVEKQTTDFKGDARYTILAGNFFLQNGNMDKAIEYYNVSKALIPGKQMVYIQLGAAYLNKGNIVEALKNFKIAYDAAPGYLDAKVIYFVGAMYAGDTTLVNKLSLEIPEETLVTDDRITSALLDTKNYSTLLRLLQRRLELKPNDPASYAAVAGAYLKLGDKQSAINTLLLLEQKLPDNKAQADQYIEAIKNGTLK